METVNTISTETKTKINVEQFLQFVDAMGIPKGKAAKIKTMAIGLFGTDLVLDSVILSRTLLGLGLSVMQVADVMDMDSSKVNANNNLRLGKKGIDKDKGDTKVWTLKDLRNTEKYTKPFTKPEFDAIAARYPLALQHVDKLLVHEPEEETELETAE